MPQDHHRREGASGWRELLIALGLTLAVMIIEAIAGLASGSLALLADAGHMLADGSALALSLFAAWMSAKPAMPAKTYGYYRTEILAALMNGVALWVIVIWIYTRAIQRLSQPLEIRTGPMLAAAGIGLAANLISSWVLSTARSRNLNVRGAWLHVLSDALGSCGVITAGLLVRFRGWILADPLASLFIGFMIAVGSWTLIKQSVNVLLEAAPAHLSLPQVTRAIREIPGVCDVHDLHVWTITTGLEAMSGHVVVEELADGSAMLQRLSRMLADRFRVTHTTFQLEPRTHACEALPGRGSGA